MGDAYMGLAGVEDASSATGLRLRAMRVSRAEMYIDRARECKLSQTAKWRWSSQDSDKFSGFKKAEDVDGECGQLMKKAVIARLRGDEELAEEWAHDHNRVWDHGVERIASNSN